MKIPTLKHLRWLRSVRMLVEASAKEGTSAHRLRERISKQDVEIRSVSFQIGEEYRPCLEVALEDGSTWRCYVELDVREGL